MDSIGLVLFDSIKIRGGGGERFVRIELER